jgi:competence protein ComFC
MLQKSFSTLHNIRQQLWEGISFWIYPTFCLHCSATLPSQQNYLCLRCKNDLPFTYFENYNEPQLIDKLFWGRADLVSTYALLFFKKDSSTQTLMHQLKYKNKVNLGIYLGKMLAQKYSTDTNTMIDFLVPIPLHPLKKYKRGYNQSECLAAGISEIWNIEVNASSLLRGVNAESQTKKGRYGRWNNVSDAFVLADKTKLENKHIALIDDVITTGATIEACVKLLQSEVKGIKISIICLAVAV